MTIPHLSHDEFLEYLKDNGCEVISGDYFDEYNRIILKSKSEKVIILQYNKTHYYPKVVKTCLNLGIAPPKEHLTCYNQRPPSKKG